MTGSAYVYKTEREAIDAFQQEMDKFGLEVNRSEKGWTTSEDWGTMKMFIGTKRKPVKGNKKLIEALRAARYMVETYAVKDEEGRRHYEFIVEKSFRVKRASAEEPQEEQEQPQEQQEQPQESAESCAAEEDRQTVEVTSYTLARLADDAGMNEAELYREAGRFVIYLRDEATGKATSKRFDDYESAAAMFLKIAGAFLAGGFSWREHKKMFGRKAEDQPKEQEQEQLQESAESCAGDNDPEQAMTEFEDLAARLGVEITVDENGVYNGMAAALASIATEVILADYKAGQEPQKDEQEKMIAQRFYQVFPYMKKEHGIKP